MTHPDQNHLPELMRLPTPPVLLPLPVNPVAGELRRTITNHGPAEPQQASQAQGRGPAALVNGADAAVHDGVFLPRCSSGATTPFVRQERDFLTPDVAFFHWSNGRLTRHRGGRRRKPPSPAAVDYVLTNYDHLLSTRYRGEPRFWQLLFDTWPERLPARAHLHPAHPAAGGSVPVRRAEEDEARKEKGDHPREPTGLFRALIGDWRHNNRDIIIFLVIMLMLSLFIPKAMGESTDGTDGLKTKEREFRAFDCSRPINLTTLTQARRKGCSLQAPKVSQTQKTYRIVQEVQRVRFNVYMCQARRSRVAFHCYYDAVISYHAFPMVREWFMNRLYPITPKECLKMWNEEQFVAPYRPAGDHVYNLNLPGRTYVTNVAWGDLYYHTESLAALDGTLGNWRPLISGEVGWLEILITTTSTMK